MLFGTQLSRVSPRGKPRGNKQVLAARKFGASCIFGKLAVIVTTRFLLKSVLKKFDHTVTLVNKDQADTLALSQIIIALIFSEADAYYDKVIRQPHYRK